MTQPGAQPPAVPQLPQLSSTLHLPPPSASGPSRQPSGQVFDFTKRKRWADLLVTELTEVVMLVLSETGVVWYCGPAVEELLGWKDEELVDGDFCEIMNESDRRTFKRQFAQCIDTRSDLEAYARLRCKSEDDLYPNVPIIPTLNLNNRGGRPPKPPPKEILFEIKGYTHYVMSSTLEAMASGSSYGMENADMQMFMQAGPSSMRSTSTGMFKCVFAMARPYPSRNTAMLNTFLELKMENERLQQRLRDLKAKSEAIERAKLENQYNLFYQSYTAPHQGEMAHGQSYSSSFSLDPVAAGSTSSYDAYYGYSDGAPRASGGIAPPGAASSSSTQVQQDEADPSSDHSLPRKKSKKSLAQEQYCCMTCGRTDSPEWRKGPHGAKTLCNACGLRWAKQVRTKDTKESKDPAVDGDGEAHDV